MEGSAEWLAFVSLFGVETLLKNGFARVENHD
jgi:hypothetical protein